MSHKSTFIKIIGLFLLLGLFVSIYKPKITISEVILSGKAFTIEVADNRVSQEKGLSGHTPLKDNEGMLFVFNNPAKNGFWMKDMLFPIDIIWISDKYEIITIKKSLSPDTYPTIYYPDVPAKYVLEIIAGESDRLNLKIGDFVEFVNK